jgi:DoxX-like family
LGETYSPLLTKAIGISEIIMAVWIISGIFPRFNAWTQIIIIATMNILEFMLVPDLLLWGKINAFFAFIFILLIYYKAVILDKSDTD